MKKGFFLWKMNIKIKLIFFSDNELKFNLEPGI